MSDQGDLFSLMASLRMTLGDVADEVKASRAQRERMERESRLAMSPFYVPFAGQAICPNPSAPFRVEMNMAPLGPSQGHIWHVRKLCAGGVTPTTTAAGRLDVYVTAAAPDNTLTLAELGLADWKDQAVSLPLVANYRDGELMLRAGERLVLIITNGTADQRYVVNGNAKDVQEAIIPPGGYS